MSRLGKHSGAGKRTRSPSPAALKYIIPSGQKIGIVNLGCARNLVDAQVILGRLRKEGYQIVNADKADVVILNTCSFIEEARRESIEAILDLIELKRSRKIKGIVVAGCLPQRYKEDLEKEFHEIDVFWGVQPLIKSGLPPQIALTPEHFAYLKICESCYNHCSFCAIPRIKGRFGSRTMESVLAEARQLDEKGVREMNIIGQDITAYGIDLYKKKSLAKLLKKIVKETRNIEWIRLFYLFPAHITDDLLEVIAGEEKICKYIDVPLQHVSDHLLKKMNRKFTARQTVDLISKIRARIPQAVLRTSLIVGLPGETENDFKTLLDFVKKVRFEKLGAFVYSREEGTPAFDMPGQVPDREKRSRFDRLMRLQKDISLEIQQQYIGRTMKVLIDEKPEQKEGFYRGRTQYDAPDVDGTVLVRARRTLKPGDFVTVRIVDATEYDLTGEAI